MCARAQEKRGARRGVDNAEPATDPGPSRPLSPQGVTTDDMVAALGLSHAELVTAINELLASVRENFGWREMG